MNRPTTLHRLLGSAAVLAGILWSVAPASAWDPLQKAERAADAGQRAMAAGDSAGALEHMLRAQALAPRDPQIRAGLAETFYDTGDFEGAIRQLQPLADEAAPPQRRERALYNAGNAAFRAQDLERALDLYTEALLASEGEADADLLTNLELAQRLLQQQEQQQQQEGEDGQPQDDSEQEQQEQQDPSDQEQQQEQQQQQENEQESGDEQQQQQQDQQSPPPSSEEQAAADSMQAPPPELETMTPEEAMRLLQALDFDEEELRKSIQRRLRGDDEENEHDW